ncbi:MAG: imelysin family protein, partial [Bacteroidota bacterium]
MRKRNLILYITCIIITATFMSSCDNDGGGTEPNPTPEDFTNHLTNQIDEVIIPTMNNYRDKVAVFLTSVISFQESKNASTLSMVRTEFRNAYLAYQAAAVHNFFATETQALVITTNLYPIDQTLLADIIENRRYNFNTSVQERANGFPAIDFMLFGTDDALAYFDEDPKRIEYLISLVTSMQERAEKIADQWSTNLRGNFISNGGTELGSSISKQLNSSVIYYEDHVRENKVGLPIGLSGPLDSPIPPDPTKIEAYYQSQYVGNEDLTLELLKVTIEELER